MKEELPKQRKGPKRAVECQLKVQTHIWEQDAAGSNPVTPTRLSLDAIRVPGSVFIFVFVLAFIASIFFVA